MLEPEGVTLEDRKTRELIHKDSFYVLFKGEWRVLELRVGRGILREPRPEEVTDIQWEQP